MCDLQRPLVTSPSSPLSRRLAGSALLLLTALSPTLRAADEAEVKIGTVHGQLKYDVESFRVKPGAKVKLTLTNSDEMQHNLLIIVPGENKPLEVAQKAWMLGADAVKKAFVPDGPDVLFHTRVLDPQQSDTITFTAPEQEGSYPFICTLPGHVFSMRGVMQVDKTAATLTVKSTKPADNVQTKFHVHVMEKPVVLRTFVDGGPARSICVGLPGGTNFLYDADECYVRFGWSGMFMDVGPNVGVNEGDRGGGWSKVLGTKFEIGDSGFPISLGDRDARQVVKFGGYRVRGNEAPQFFFTINGRRVTQTVRPAPFGIGLQMEYEFESDPGKLFYYVSPHFLQLTSSVGTWQSGRLEIPAGQSRKFTVTIVRQAKDDSKLKTPAVAP